MPFAIQRIQTDRGQLRDWHIKFGPIRPRSPLLNGKVERAQRTALEEFWPTMDLADTALSGQLDEWQTFYIRAAERIEATSPWRTRRPHADRPGL